MFKRMGRPITNPVWRVVEAVTEKNGQAI